MNKDKKPKIFLSYAHEDIGMAKRIYEDLKRYGLDLWFDNESLLGGQNWKFEINKAIKQSTCFLAILSNESINTIGYVQKELKIALDMLDLHPKNKTYILPVRIEECEPIEERLSELHWIDVFPERDYQAGIRKILAVMNPDGLLLRSTPIELTSDEATDIIRKYGFFEVDRNGTKRFQNKFKPIKDGKVIFDEATGLMWQQSGSDKYLNFDAAKKYIKNLNKSKFDGYTDWRLPTLEEAMSLMEPIRSTGLFINSIFNNNQRWIWTSDKVLGENSRWFVDFSNGECNYSKNYNITIDIQYIRAVQSSGE